MAEPETGLALSVVVPVFNERDNLVPLHRRIRETVDPLAIPYEILLVDDGSTDGGTIQLREIAGADPRVRLLELARNFGQTAAITAGFEHARGAIIIPLDADLQNDPADIPQILSKLSEGYDVVSCWRKNRQDAWLSRVLPSRVANRIISAISGVYLHDYGCTLKGYRRELVQHIRLYGEMHRFLPIYATWAGARVTEIAVQHHPRRHGKSKYGIARTVKVLLDLVTIKFLGSYGTKPMYVYGGFGLLSFLGGLALSAATLWEKFALGTKVHNNPLFLLSVVCFIVGVQFILIGLVAELIVRTYHESQHKPIYILRATPR
jgi:glycosyltransferase involved in cell wall biosynthesis